MRYMNNNYLDINIYLDLFKPPYNMDKNAPVKYISKDKFISHRMHKRTKFGDVRKLHVNNIISDRAAIRCTV